VSKISPVPTSDPTAPSPAPYVFHLGPFRFESEIDIPELRTSTGSGESVVAIRLGVAPRSIEGAVAYGEHCQIAPTEYLLEIAGTARYYVHNGSEVLLEIEPGVPPANVSAYLLGSVFGVLCHQNGLLPLHASAIECGGAVTAFLGDSGAGKSTLAACLQRRGHRIVSDDICLLQSDSNSNSDSKALLVVPVAGWLKLWNQSLQHLGETPIEQNRVFSTDDKFRLFLPDSGSQRPRLERVVFLAKSPHSQAQPALQPVPLLEAIAGLMEMTYAGYVPSLAGQQSRVFQQCASVFQHAQAWRLIVPWGLDRMESVLDLLEKDIFHSIGGAAAPFSIGRPQE
jgi:energy-coupling factor transporter ATP-binding protein EcfA2